MESQSFAGEKLDIPKEEKELQINTLNVLEGRVDINTFPLDYQEKIKSYYRFSATRYNSKYPVVATRTNDTLDLI